ncbi:helix-hairpin-helix domain-containing protein [Thermotoga caldifontis]|uniref:helix-hairpin-helix domain-containing protein n=1 Tax=Thermotoga caldifontis TaxID=1508419 RepID=UPI0005974232|nr:DNA polymerase III subunit alpha [Thermotoga caldifontis]
MIPCIVSPYSFDGSVVRLEQLAQFAKEKGLKSLLLADTNFHSVVLFNVLCRQNGLIPVHGLRMNGKIYYARDREEFEELVKSYNVNREPGLNFLRLDDVKLIYHLDRSCYDAHLFMARLVGAQPQEPCDLPDVLIDPAAALGASAYELKVSHKLLSPRSGWLDELLHGVQGDRKMRLSREIELVKRLGFESYFYTVKRIVDIAKENQILIGPGRGSAVASLLAYLLGITSIDPIAHDLMFERFLHEGRTELPDIDIDVADEQREQLLNLLKRSFPYFAQISAFVTLTEKNLTSEASRLNLKLNPNVLKCLVGLPLRRSVHAAGIIVAAEPLNLPLVPSAEGPIVEYDMDSLERVGVVKIDLLGLRTLTVLDRLKKRAGVSAVKIEDNESYELLSRGKTCGIFQLESRTARSLCRTVRPTNLNELSILLAMNRPGPLGAGLEKTYAMKKRGCVKFDHDFFPETRGVIVYQEQVMKLAMDFAGFDAVEADLFRKAISEKDPKIIQTAMDKFRDRLREKGYTSEFVDRLCDILVKFASYAFNKSHSVAYAHLSYELAYLKTHWPKEFFEIYIREHSSDQYKIFLAVQELRSMGYRVLPPSINQVHTDEKTFHLPLEAVNGVSESIARTCRQMAPFNDLKDFVEKTKLSLSTVQKLVWAGVFDEMYESRAAALEDFEAVQKGFDQDLSLVAAKVFGKRVESRQKISYSETDITELEMKAFGFALSPWKVEFDRKFAPLSEVFASARTLPVAVKVSGKFASDGMTICQLKNSLPDGHYVLILTPDGNVLEHEKLDSVRGVVYEMENCFDERDFEEACETERVQTVLCGKKVLLEGVRPLLDWYRIRFV